MIVDTTQKHIQQGRRVARWGLVSRWKYSVQHCSLFKIMVLSMLIVQNNHQLSKIIVSKYAKYAHCPNNRA